MSDVEETIKSILAGIKNSPTLQRELSGASNIVDDVGLDSLEMLQFMLEVEEQMDLRIDFEKLEYEHLFAITSLAEFLKGMPSRSAARDE